jgi:hypothetical protein
VYLIAFLGVGAVAYWKGSPARAPSSQARPIEATATVSIRETHSTARDPATGAGGAAPETSNPRPAVARPDPSQVQQQILALADEDERGRLQVETRAETLPGEKSPGQWKVSLTLRDTAADRAAQNVNTLARAYAEAYRAEWKSSVDRVYEGARATTDRAAEQFRQSQSRLNALRDRQIQAAREALQRPQPAPPAASPPADNPDWTALDRQLTEFRAQRTELLASRTPVHPAIQDLDGRIALAEEQLAMVPRQPPGAAVATPPKVEASASLPDPAELQGLRRAVEEAGRAHEEAIRTERFAWQARFHEPMVELQPAFEPPAPRRWPVGAMALLGAVATGLTMVVGLGMISAGAGIEPPLTTIAQLEAAAGAPVVGVVPGTEQAPLLNPERQHLLRWALIIAGVLASAGGLAMLWIVHPA